MGEAGTGADMRGERRGGIRGACGRVIQLSAPVVYAGRNSTTSKETDYGADHGDGRRASSLAQHRSHYADRGWGLMSNGTIVYVEEPYQDVVGRFTTAMAYAPR